MLLPITGHPLHTRTLTVSLSLDQRGKWKAQGNVIDLRKTGFAPMSTSLQPAGIIHLMSIDLVIDEESLKIEFIQQGNAA